MMNGHINCKHLDVLSCSSNFQLLPFVKFAQYVWHEIVIVTLGGDNKIRLATD